MAPQIAEAGAPAINSLSRALHAPFTLRSRNVASLLAGDGLAAPTGARRKRRTGFVVRLSRMSHAVALQEIRGSARDLIEFTDVLQESSAYGSFTDDGNSGGVVFLLSPELVAMYHFVTLMGVVPGRIERLRMLGPGLRGLGACPAALAYRVPFSRTIGGHSCGWGCQCLRPGRRSYRRGHEALVGGHFATGGAFGGHL